MSDGGGGGDRRSAVADQSRRGVGRWLDWVRGYGGGDLSSDLVAGAAVAMLLLPQAMAYALLAGLPAETGFYAALAPAILYAVAGSSRFLSVGPVALVSLLVADAIGRHGGDRPLETALALAAMVGLVLVAIGAFRLAFLMNFISEPVLLGFTTAAALLIAATQVRHLLGIDLPRGLMLHETVLAVFRAEEIHGAAVLLGLLTVGLLLASGRPLLLLLRRLGAAERARVALSRSAPLAVVLLSVAAVTLFELDSRWGVPTTGEPGSAIPRPTLPPFDLTLYRDLVPSALTIAAVAYITSVAIGTSLGGRRRERVELGREAIGLGLGNLGAAFTGGYPVGGSVSRSAVAFDARARSPLAAAVGGVLAVTAAALAGPWVAVVPKAVLAGIVLSAVIGMIDLPAIRRIWDYSKPDGLSLLATLVAVVALGVEPGIALGAVVGVALYLWRTSQPRVVVEGKVEGAGVVRSADRDGVSPEVSPVLIIRIDHSLYFANIRHIEERVLSEVAERDGVSTLLLNLQAVNEIDASALRMLERLTGVLEEAGISTALAEVKRPVAERLRAAGFLDRVGRDRLFLTTEEALETLRKMHAPPAVTSSPAG